MRVFCAIPWPTGNASVVQYRRSVTEFSWLADNRHIVSAEIDEHTPGTHLWLLDTQNQTGEPITIGSGEEHSPAVSPAGDKIAYAAQQSDFDLSEVRLDGSPLRTLLSTSRNETDPAWSPVNAQYAFVTDRTGRQQIWLRSEDGQLERPLASEKDFAETGIELFDSPAFSPDGQRLAYHRLGKDGNKIWISWLAGSPPVRLTTTISEREEAPTWSPDATWIAYAHGTAGRWRE